MTTFFIQPGTMSFGDRFEIKQLGNLAVETQDKSMWGTIAMDAPKASGTGLSVRETLALEALKLLWSTGVPEEVSMPQAAVKLADDLLAGLNAVKEKKV